ncbi:hypothetical protein EDD11_005680 [Mortierella claussenii]|nr:hypothetical protein EDD11_005680 [Mortierella claussenii]
MTATTAPAPAEPAVASHEVGMMFVHEYYTFLNKEPSRLHCFYNKQSTMSHGIQGDEPHISHGQQASISRDDIDKDQWGSLKGKLWAELDDIHAKILDLDFEDCKVLVSNVDSQSSLNGGIMIQVLGEMSNKGGPSQKFVQTFFLAEQPKGYYVLNDIFRYLKEDTELEFEAAVEEPEAENETEPVVTELPAEILSVDEVASVDDASTLVETAPPTDEAEPEVKEEKSPVPEEKKNAEKKTEHKKQDKKFEKKDTKKDDKEAKKEAKKEEDAAEKSETPELTKKQAEPAQEEIAASTSASASTPVAAAPAVAPASVSAEPPKPKTWANLAANNSNQWGAHVAPGAKGASINVAQPTPKLQTPQAQTQNKPQSQRPSNGREEVHGIYVKNITDKMSVEQLREAFSEFGAVKNFELTPKKNCAYVDFDSAEAVQAALKKNKVSVGSETVLAEERRPRGSFQNGSRSFHYQNNNGHQGSHGSLRGRPSRGGFQDRKSIHRPEKAAPTVAVN